MNVNKLKKEVKTISKRESKREKSDTVSVIQSVSVSLALMLAMAIFAVACPSSSSNSGGNGNSNNGNSNNGNSNNGISKTEKPKYVVYRADQDTDDVFELYSVPITGAPTGTEPTKINKTLAANRAVEDFLVSPDGSTVVYTADQDANDVVELYSIPITGAISTIQPIKLNGTLIAGGDVMGDVLRIFPDGSRVVYLAEQAFDRVFDMYSVPITGATTSNPIIKLNNQIEGTDVLGNLNGTAVIHRDFQILPDGSGVVYVAGGGGVDVYTALTPGRLMVGPSTGVTATIMNPAVQIHGPTQRGDILDFLIFPDGSRVFYRVADVGGAGRELYSVPITGHTTDNPAIKIDGTREVMRDVSARFLFSPDGTRVFYRVDHDANDVFELYSVPITGATTSNPPIQISRDFVDGARDVSEDFLFSPDGTRVFYRADQDTDDVIELYSVPITGAISSIQPIKINKTLPATRNLEGFQFSPDGSRVVYRADQDTDDVFELYSVPVTGATTGTEPIKLNGDLASGRNVEDDWKFAFTR